MGNPYSTSTDEALSGTRPGIWKLDRPIVGYKRINCDCENNIRNFRFKFIAELMVPIGAKVVRSKQGTIVSDKIRTDNYTINRINAMSIIVPAYEKCVPINCRSIENTSFKYEAGKSYQPDKLDERTNVECTNGLYFFFKEQDAYNYGNTHYNTHYNDDDDNNDGPVPPIGHHDDGYGPIPPRHSLTGCNSE